MSTLLGFNRRAFLRSAGMTALAGISGSAAGIAAAAQPRNRNSRSGPYNFGPYDRFGTDSYKWDYQEARFGKGNVKVGMGIADMDFEAAPCITEALASRSEHHNWGYMRPPDSYFEAVSDWNRDRHGIEVDPKLMEMSSGVHAGLIAALNTVSPPASKVLLMTPTYNGFYSDLRWSRTVKNESRMIVRDDGSYAIDWDDLESRMTPDTHSILLCNPQNPTGNCWSAEDLLRLGRLCLENEVIVLSDEIHCDFVMKGQTYTPFASLPDKDVVDNSLTFKAISKTFSLAAMKNAYFFSTNPILLERVKENHRSDLNSLGIYANEAAYRRGADWVDQLMPIIDGNHNLVESTIREKMPLLKYKKAQGTYLAWVNVEGLIEATDAKRFSELSQVSDTPMTPTQVLEVWLVENAGVQLNPGSSYGAGGESYMRMNLGAPRVLIEQGLDLISEALKRV